MPVRDIEIPDAPVEPGSLFVQQLIDRIGKDQAMCVLEDKEDEAMILLEDPMTGYWRENWFLDGKKATLRTMEKGLFFSAGTVTNLDLPGRGGKRGRLTTAPFGGEGESQKHDRP